VAINARSRRSRNVVNRVEPSNLRQSVPSSTGVLPVLTMKRKELAMNLTWWSEDPSELPLLFLTVVVTHLLMSFSQTLMHYGLGHRRLGGMFFRNHIHYHHVNYSKDHLVSLVYVKNDGDGNNTPFFLIPVALMLSSTYFIFPLRVFLVQIVAAFASFLAHVYLDNQYHIAGSPLLRFAWFRRKQQLHFVHHTHGNSSSILFIIHMATAILHSSTIFGTDFWVPTEIPMRMMWI
jgi:hypothetical protein